MGNQDPMTEHPDQKKATEQEQEPDESQQGGFTPGGSDDPAVEPDIPLPAEDSELSEGA